MMDTAESGCVSIDTTLAATENAATVDRVALFEV
jgi:hypothetical protein